MDENFINENFWGRIFVSIHGLLLIHDSRFPKTSKLHWFTYGFHFFLKVIVSSIFIVSYTRVMSVNVSGRSINLPIFPFD